MHVNEKISYLDDRQALIIVPPFASLIRPALGAHILQACARRIDIDVGILYANIAMAEDIGVEIHEAICYAPSNLLIGEWIFAQAAYNCYPLSQIKNRIQGELIRGINLSEIEKLEITAKRWVDAVGEAVARHEFKVVGCTTTFEQTAASIALLGRIKTMQPDIVTILGGSNCQGRMADGLLSVGAADYIFEGESEVTFPEFLLDIINCKRPADRIVYGKPCMDLDRIPTPEFTDFYNQIEPLLSASKLIHSGNIWLPYESSRGCWWGEHHHCTFCGIDEKGIAFRRKSTDRVLQELKALLSAHPNRNVNMVDSIMPRQYLRDLIPRLDTEIPGAHIFYEVRSDLALEDLIAMSRAGVRLLQPGIESLSTHCLSLMNKGITAEQNIAFLRYSRSIGVGVNWNLLHGVPGDKQLYYQQMLEIIPYLVHLHPPACFAGIRIERFSPYFEDPEKYGISNLRPIDAYRDLLPEGADIWTISRQFIGDYASDSLEHPELITELKRKVDSWQERWGAGRIPPILSVTDLENDRYLLLDSRGLPESQPISFLSHDRALVALISGAGSIESVEWAIERGVVVELDSILIPLATSDPELLIRFQNEVRSSLAS